MATLAENTEYADLFMPIKSLTPLRIIAISVVAIVILSSFGRFRPHLHPVAAGMIASDRKHDGSRLHHKIP
jgi:hypothetical protein